MILFNLLAVRSLIAEELGGASAQGPDVVFDGDAGDLADSTMQDIISHVDPS